MDRKQSRRLDSTVGSSKGVAPTSKSLRGPRDRGQIPRAPGGSGYLQLTDASKRREEERLLYRKKSEEIKVATHQLRSHEEEDLPQFRTWFHVEFGRLINDIIDLDDRSKDLQDFLDGLEFYRGFKKISKSKAFTKLSEVREKENIWEFLERECPQTTGDENGDNWEDFLGGLFGGGRERFGQEGDRDGDDPFDREDPWQQGRSHHRAQDHGAQKPRSPKETSGQDLHALLKGLYRQLVRALHPDAGVENTPFNQQLWNEVQEAYQLGDVQSLSELHQKVCHPGGRGGSFKAGALDFKTIPIGDVMELRKELESRLKDLQKKLRWARKDPHWEFVKLREKGGKPFLMLSTKLKKELDVQHQGLSGLVDYLERELKGWEKASSRSQSRPISPSMGKTRRTPGFQSPNPWTEEG